MNPSPISREYVEKGYSDTCPLVDMHCHMGPFLGSYLPNNSVETMFMMTEEEYFFVSSKTVKEVASLKGSVKDLVPPNVVKKLAEKFGGPFD